MPDETLAGQLVERIIDEWTRARFCSHDDERGHDESCFEATRREHARIGANILAWLAERGRLLPDGGLTRTERAIETPRGKVHRVLDETEARTCRMYGPGVPVSRQVTNWPDGTALTGPWVPVPDSTEAKDGERD